MRRVLRDRLFWFYVVGALLVGGAQQSHAAGKVIRDGALPGSTLIQDPTATYAWQRGPLLPDDGSTVAHVIFRECALVAWVGPAWTQVGTVPQVPSSGAVPPGAGPFAVGNYYSNGAIEQHSSFTMCAFVLLTSNTTTQVVAAEDAGGVNRNFAAYHEGTLNRVNMYVFSAASFTNQIYGVLPANGRHLYCLSYKYVTDGTSVLITQVDSAFASTSTAVGPPATTITPFTLGRTATGGGNPWLGYVFEMALWSRDLSTVEMTNIYNSLRSAGAI